MMTSQENELVEYLKHHPVVMNNTVLVDGDLIKNTISYLLENEITVLSLSFVKLSKNGVKKQESANISYLERIVSPEIVMSDVQSTTAEYTHIEISIRLKNQP